jgi:hypothetical protein
MRRPNALLLLVLVTAAVIAWESDQGVRAQSQQAKQPMPMRATTQAQRKAAAARAAAAQQAAAQATGAVNAQAAAAGVGNPTAFGVAAPGGTPDYFGFDPNWANSPLLRKFVDRLPGLTAAGVNNLGQYIPVANPDVVTYPGSDYYEISVIEYTEKMHSDLPRTKLRGYVQRNTGTNLYSTANTGGCVTAAPIPAGSHLCTAADNTVAPSPVHYLGPTIVAQKDRPTRIKFTNELPVGASGDLFIPTDTTVMGAGAAPDGTSYSQNRATLHLHGGVTPWVSDGTPHQWTVPAAEPASTTMRTGVSTQPVPDMAIPANGSMTFYWSNQQSGRLMFYHDHAYGITRLNVYAGEAAGYLLTDSVERALTNGTTAGIPAMQDIPLIIQDKTFVSDATTPVAYRPSDGVPLYTTTTDPTWDTTRWGGVGGLWFPHVYMPNQNPGDMTGTNPMGRWDYALWFWPPYTGILNHGALPNPYYDPVGAPWEYQSIPGTPNPSIVPEAFLDTPVINGTAYPTLTVDPKPYRFRILNAANDRMWNLSLYLAGSNNPMWSSTGTLLDPNAGEVPMVPASPNPAIPFPVDWTTASDGAGIRPDILDGRVSGVPNPSYLGPSWVQIGTEGGLLPAPVVIPPSPTGYQYNLRNIVVLNVSKHSLFMGPAERADVIVDFSQFAGKTLILYNDAPAPVPAGDSRVDYYTGNPDQTDTGGAPPTLPGYGPNTRTIMQIRVNAGTGTPLNLPALQTAFASTATTKGAFAASQDPIIVTQAPYNSAYNGNFPDTDGTVPAAYAPIQDTSMSFGTVGGSVMASFPFQPKAIQELFETDYGRMNATLGVELAFTNANNQTTVPLGYIDPTTEILDGSTASPVGPVAGDGTQIWKITHNGVDTHAIHFHLFNVQVINRVGWDGAIRPPDANELGWKETVRMSPLEDIIVALRPVAPLLPFGLPDSVRPLNPAMPVGATWPTFDPLTGGAITVTNALANFGWEYVWHCHLLGHEENDMMRPIQFNFVSVTPAAPVLTYSAGNLTWTDATPGSSPTTMGNPANEIGFIIQRAPVAGGVVGSYTTIGTAPANSTRFAVAAGGTNSYRVVSYNAAGSATSNSVIPGNATTPPAVPSGLTGTIASATSIRLAWTDNSTTESSFAVWRSVNGAAFTQIAALTRTAAQRLATGGTVTYTNIGLSAGNTYAYFVTAVASGVASSGSNTATVDFSAPSVPTNLAGGRTTTTSVALSWTDTSNNETSFTIQRATDSLFTVGLTTLPSVGANVTTATNSPVVAATPYYYQVRASNLVGDSAWSNVLLVPPRPTVTGIAPAGGPPAGGTAVTITGTNFQTGATVAFGGTPAVGVVVVSPTSITVLTPAHAAGVVNVVVANPGGLSGTRASGFTYAAPPTVAAVAPATGPIAGGTVVTITGTGFVSGATVNFGGAAATGVTFVSATSMRATTPARPSGGAVTVEVVNPSGQVGALLGGFTYLGSIAPTVTSVTPNAGVVAGGTTVTIVGTNFASNASVSFGGVAAATTFVSATQLRAVTPAHANGAVNVVVTNNPPGGLSGTLINGFTYGLTVTSIVASSGSTAGGDQVTITGTNFSTTGATVTIGGAAATSVAVANLTTITATTPAGAAGAADVVVTTGGLSGTLAGGYTYTVVQPTVTAVTPASGSTAGGTAVTITGSNFAAGATVAIGGVAATGVVVVNSKTITATTGASLTGGAVSVDVSNPGGLTNPPNTLFTYLAPPAVTGVAPTVGPTAGGTAVTITGTNFVVGATVTFGAVAATNVVVASATSITATTPAGAVGAVDVVVKNPNLLTGTLPGGFTYAVPPTVTSVAPASGSTIGGTSITITGTGFQAGATVTFGGTAATNVIVVSATSITATTPAHIAGAVSVLVTNFSGLSNPANSAFAYIAPPIVTSIAPSSGSTAGGDVVTITGTGFQTTGTTAVSVGGIAATGVVVQNATTMKATTPAHAVGAVNLVVTNPDGQAVTVTGGFTYAVVQPTVTAVSPNNGPMAGGTSVTITGTNFATGATVTFGGNAATATVVNSSTIAATTPLAATAGPADVVVTNPGPPAGTLTGGYTYLAPATPSVTLVTPNVGSTAGGTAVTITGTNFAAGATVTFAGVAATNVVVVSPTSVTATAPPGAAGAASVVVTVSGLSNVANTAFSYFAPPTVTAVLPTSGSTVGGAATTISGTGFQAGATVTFGGTAATSVVVAADGLSLTAVTPAHAAGLVSVVVTNPAAAAGLSGTLPNAFTYLAPPTVTAVAPAIGPLAGGTAVTITGTGFQTTGTTTVSFGGTAATSVVVVSVTSITATTPAHAAGAVSVVVANPDGQVNAANAAFTYIPPPTVTAVLPTSGSTVGGTSVTITGTGFQTTGATTVSFGGTAATSVVVVSATSITATTPAHAAGAVSVVVANPDGQVNAANAAFTYIPPPTVTAVLPTSGSTVGGTAVTITGTGFQTTGTTTVSFGGTAATSVVVVSATSITATTPAHAAGAVSVVVTNPDGQVNAANTAFTYIPPPTVTAVAPASGPLAGGTAVTITGTGFQTTGTTTVSFGGTAATSVVVVSATSITATTPVHAAGAVSVVVTNPDGQVNPANTAYTYLAPPTVTSVTPNTGSLAGGTPVTIAGTNFASPATVTIGGVAATSVVVVSATSITAATPAGAAGAVNVVVTTPGGTVTLTNGFTYAALAVDVTTSTDRSTSATTIASPAFTTAAPNELLLAFISADGPSSGTNTTVTGVAGGGLTWTLVQRTNARLGTAEIWRAFAASAVSGQAVTATLSQSVAASITVVSFRNVNPTTPVGAVGTGNGATGPQSASLTTQAANSFVFGVGTDWDSATGRTVGSNQTMVHQYLATVGDTYWVQRQNATAQPAGTVVTISDTAPTTDRWNLSIVEIRGQ